MLHPIPTRLGAIALLAACAGCPGGLEDPSRFDQLQTASSCPDVPQTVLLPKCATALCHSAEQKMSGLDLQSPNVASRLVGAPAMGGPGLLIDPSNPAESVLYTKVTATPPFGVQMPFGEPALDDATIGCVLQWVTEQVDGGTGGSATDGAAEGAVSDEASTVSDDDGSAVDEASLDDTDATVPEAAAPIVDAGSTPDVHVTHTRDASASEASPPEASADAESD